MDVELTVVNQGPACNSSTSCELALEVMDCIAKTQEREKEGDE